MKAVLYIAYKYLFLKNKTQSINVLSLITMIAMACGSAALVVVLSTFNGFENLSKNLNESFQSDLTIMPIKNKHFAITPSQLESLNQNKNILSFSKTIEEKIYVKYLESEAIATIKGVDENYFQTNDIKDYLLDGDTVLEDEERTYCMLGVGIANKLAINPNVELEPISIYLPKSESIGSISIQDNFELGYVYLNGVFSIYQEYDEKYVIAPLAFVQYLQNTDENTLSTLELKLKKGSESEVRNELQTIFNHKVLIKNKLELNASFYKISRIEKFIVFLILIFVLIILSFNFIGSLTMHTIEKSHDIKVLNYLGLTGNKIFSLYLTLGIFQGMLGGLIGVIIGLLICMIQIQFGIVQLPGSGTFVVNSYPVVVDCWDILFIILILCIISSLASIWPALQARKLCKIAVK